MCRAICDEASEQSIIRKGYTAFPAKDTVHSTASRESEIRAAIIRKKSFNDSMGHTKDQHEVNTINSTQTVAFQCVKKHDL